MAAVPWTGPFDRPETWWAGVQRVLEHIAERIEPQAVDSIAVDGTSATILVTDAAGSPLAPALSYDDARASAHARRIRAVAPPASGAHGATSALAKLLWFIEQLGADRIAHAASQADWIAFRLGAPLGLSDDNNALKLGWDPMARRWPAWIESLGVPRRWLPQVQPPGTTVGKVRTAIRDRYGFPSGSRVLAGTTDSVAATLAAGAREPGDAVTTLGSTLVVKVVSERAVFSPEHGVYSHRLGDRWLAGGASNTGGAVLRHFFTDSELGTLTPLLEPDRPTGLDYYPLLRPGERFPTADPDLAPRLGPRPQDRSRFLQGLLEAMARIEAEGYHLLARLGAPYPKRVLTTGGGAVNPAWRRIRARVLGVPVHAAPEAEAACGSARLHALPVT